ncbi:RloB domain-containing protein [Xanthobacter autotrophicus]|uniref:RloB domain-containing protein n=1 Tax=Xanthobacter autotrophicus TaxID=280 RepID=UPI00372A16AB
MRRPRPTIIPRRPIFLGCEGESEQGYGQLLNDLLRAADIPVHLEVVTLNPGVGDPITRLRRAEQEIIRRQQRRSEFAGKVVLMDSDQADDGGRPRREIEQLARQLRIAIIWQEPCHEAFLLRHLDGSSQRRPPTTTAAGAALRAEWPQYTKPMTKLHLARRIGLAEILRAATVEVALADFLRELGLLT